MSARILVADGVATSRIRLKVRLTSACYDVSTTDTAADLLRQARETKPALVILGHGLDDPHPVQLCHRFSQDPDLANIPVLMMTDPASRVDALRAGATAVLDSNVSELMLLARVRGLLRDTDRIEDPGFAMAEAQTSFESVRPLIALIADNPARAIAWRRLLAQSLSYRFQTMDTEEALGSAADRGADLYLISADIQNQGDGLRLLSELRSRPGSKNAGFIIATSSERQDMESIALDLGAGDILPLDLTPPGRIEVAALALQAQLARKKRADTRRAEARQNMMLAMTDPLTGLHNRRFALPRLAEIAEAATSARSSFAIFLLDLDRFKAVNDNHGHAAGDAVLRHVAQCLTHHVGPDGLIARMGGEEFLIALPNHDQARAFHCAEAIRQHVAASPVTLPGSNGGLTITATLSVGVAVAEGGLWHLTPEDLADMIQERADRALLCAKSMGRNKVMLAQAERAA